MFFRAYPITFLLFVCLTYTESMSFRVRKVGRKNFFTAMHIESVEKCYFAAQACKLKLFVQM